MEPVLNISGPLARDLALKASEEFYNQCHGKGGKFCPTSGKGGGFSPGVEKYLKEQYQMNPATAKRLGLTQDGTKLLIPFKNEKGKTTNTKWRDTAVKEGEGRWGPPNSKYGLSLYENASKKGPLFVVESPSEGLILAGHNHRVVFFDGADSLVSRTGTVNKKVHSQLTRIIKGKNTILVPDNDVRGEAFAKVVEPMVSQRINPPSQYKDLRQYLIEGNGTVDGLVGS